MVDFSTAGRQKLTSDLDSTTQKKKKYYTTIRAVEIDLEHKIYC